MLSIRSFPRAILHVDGDCFFASCEVAKDPSLRGKCVVTGLERGIASSMTYEAKARGVTRAMKLSDIRKLIPDVIMLPSDYESYSLYSRRMYGIVRRYTEAIEEYSIDECFADLTGMRRPNKMSYEAMAERIKNELDTELGMTFSVGLSVNKVTAKIASKWKKPSGLTVIRGKDLHLYLAKLPHGKVWGIGPQTSAYMDKIGFRTALDFAKKDKEWVKDHFSKPFQDIHRELNGEFVYPLDTEEKHDYSSVSKTKTFTPPSSDPDYVFSELSKNVENACIKLRRHELFTKRFVFFLKTQDFRYHALEIKLRHSVSVPNEILSLIRENFRFVFRRGVLYRATGITLMELSHSDATTLDLFGDNTKTLRINKIYEAIDNVSSKYGKHSVFLGSSFKALKKPVNIGNRTDLPWRQNHPLKGESKRKRIGIPYLGEVK